MIEVKEVTEIDLIKIQDTEIKLSSRFATDPDMFLQDIGGRERLRDMIYDVEVKAGIETRRSAVRNMEWSLNSENESVYNFVYPQIFDNYSNIINNAWSCIPFGYSVFQIVWKFENGYMIDIVKDEKFENFAINEDFQLLPMFFNKIKADELYPEKFFVTVYDQSSKYPMGEPLLATVYFPWLFSRNGIDFYMELLESYGKPFLHVTANSKDPETINIIKQIIMSKRPRAVSTSNNIEIKMIETQRDGSSFAEFISIMDAKIQRSLLGQTLTSGTQGVGSQALGKVHNDVRIERVISDCEVIKPTIQNVINTICNLNNIKEVPCFEFHYPKIVSEERVNRDIKLNSIGVKFTKDYIAEKYDLDLNEFEIVENNPLQDMFSFSENEKVPDFSGRSNRVFEMGKKEKSQLAARESLESEAIKKAGEVLDMNELEKIIKNSKSAKDLEKKLQFFISSDSPDYNDALTQLLYQVNLQGGVDTLS